MLSLTMKNQKRRKRAPNERSSLVPVDPLTHYLQQVSQYPLLTDEEERSLVERVQKFRDIDAAKVLVTSHLRLVVKIAMEYRTAYHNLLDLIQEGNVGLLRAVKSYDPNKGARLAYYASWWIRSYILKYILDNFRLIKIGTTQAQRKLFFNLMKEKEKIERMGYRPGTKLLADRLEVKEQEVTEMDQRLSHSELSIDTPIGDSEGPLHVDFLKDTSQPADEKLSDRELKDVLSEKFRLFAKNLNPRELKIFQERLLAEVPKTLQDIADEYGITRERVRQIEERIKAKLKNYFEESGFKIDEVR
jgi:RNA polymerase sigma-32 factor